MSNAWKGRGQIGLAVTGAVVLSPEVLWDQEIRNLGLLPDDLSVYLQLSCLLQDAY